MRSRSLKTTTHFEDLGQETMEGSREDSQTAHRRSTISCQHCIFGDCASTNHYSLWPSRHIFRRPVQPHARICDQCVFAGGHFSRSRRILRLYDFPATADETQTVIPTIRSPACTAPTLQAHRGPEKVIGSAVCLLDFGDQNAGCCLLLLLLLQPFSIFGSRHFLARVRLSFLVVRSEFERSVLSLRPKARVERAG